MAGGTEHVLDLVISQAQARLDQLLGDFDALDTKSMGVLGADAAALGVVIATRTSLNAFWWIPVIPLTAAAFMLLWAVRPRGYDEGPDMRDFFTKFGGLPYEGFALQLLGDLLAAVEWNKEINTRKARTFKPAFVVFVLGLFGAFVVGVFR